MRLPKTVMTMQTPTDKDRDCNRRATERYRNRYSVARKQIITAIDQLGIQVELLGYSENDGAGSLRCIDQITGTTLEIEFKSLQDIYRQLGEVRNIFSTGEFDENI